MAEEDKRILDSCLCHVDVELDDGSTFKWEFAEPCMLLQIVPPDFAHYIGLIERRNYVVREVLGHLVRMGCSNERQAGCPRNCAINPLLHNS